MRKSTSIAGLLLAAGASWLASNAWRNNAGGIRDRVGEGSSRLRARGERLWRQGAERLGRRGKPTTGESYGYEDWRHYRADDASPLARRPYDER